MKRDELEQLIRDLRAATDRDTDGVWTRASAAISWLERLPAGCELVGCNPMNELDGTEHAVYDVSAPRGRSWRLKTWWVNPDDLTKAGKR